MTMNLTIKSLRTWATDDGGGYQFNLCKDGKKIAYVHNAGDGGMLQILWDSCEDEVTEYAKSLPPVTVGDKSFGMSVDILMDDLVTEYEWQKKLARYRKGATLFRLLSDPVDSFRTLKTLDASKAKEYLEKTYPNNYVMV
jgi:hypothetical protein